jgi:hypothetical protein
MTGKQWAIIFFLLGILALLCWANITVFNAIDFSKLPTSTPNIPPTNTTPPTPTALQHRKAVTGLVQSQNRLGVLLQANFRCDLHYIPDRPTEWVLDNLVIKE